MVAQVACAADWHADELLARRVPTTLHYLLALVGLARSALARAPAAHTATLARLWHTVAVVARTLARQNEAAAAPMRPVLARAAVVAGELSRRRPETLVAFAALTAYVILPQGRGMRRGALSTCVRWGVPGT
jgi:hypothetical protein